MKILLVHNYYQQPGGEDQVFADESLLLENHGHHVLHYTVHNDAVKGMNSLALAARTVWNPQTYKLLRELVRREQPAVVHFQNTFPLVSPAAYYAVRREGAAVVQELPNYRLLCPAAILFRNGQICEQCVGKAFAWDGIKHKCYRGSRSASAVIAGMTAVHRLVGTWNNAVDAYIALTESGKETFIAGGLPASKIMVKGNFVSPDPGPGKGDGGYAIYVGRLNPEKGIATLLSAWSQIKSNPPLKIVGDGPMAETVKAAAAKNSGIEWLGRRPSAEIYDLVGAADVLICPSEWHETGGPKTVLEALAKGTPVIASRVGSMRDVVRHGDTGLHFEPGNADDLVMQVRSLLADRQALGGMRLKARRDYETAYTEKQNYSLLMQIYERALAIYRGESQRKETVMTASAGLPTSKG